MKVILENYALLLQGFKLTMILSAIVISGGIVVGTILALCRISKKMILKRPVSVYIDTMRSIPLIMVLFWFYFLLPVLTKKPMPPIITAVISLTFFVAAFYAEVIRSGIQSIPRGQTEAAISTGLSYARIMLHIILPQAFRKMIPGLVGLSIETLKSTSVVFLIGLIEFFRAATIINNRVYKSFEIFTFVAIVYFAVCFPMSLISRKSETPRVVID
jgi:His/Glu/Gln/Arg/opine family amino acid ABC transporter permease subunit